MHNLTNGGYEFMCYTCEVSDDPPSGHAADQKDKRGNH